MAEDKNKNTPQPVRESVVPTHDRGISINHRENVKDYVVTNTRPAPVNPFRNGDDKKDD